MSIRYLTVPVGDGEIKIAVAPVEPAQGGGFQKMGIKEQAQKAADVAEKVFDQMSFTIGTLANGFKDAIKNASPDEASLEFSLAVKSDAGVVLVQSGVEAALKVNLTWKRKDS